MADWLLIKLPAMAGAAASWLVADSSGRLVAPEQHGSLAEAAVIASSCRVCAVAPAEEVLLAEVDVPAKAGARAQQIVPFALEEQLAEDVERLHFAVGRRLAPSARTPVAIVSKSAMDGWLAELAGARLTAEALYAESDLIPANPGQAVAVLSGTSVIVRPAGRLPTTMPLDALAEALALVLPSGEDSLAPSRTGHGLVLYTGAAEWQQHSRTVEAVRDRFDGIKVQLLTDGSLGLLAQHLPTAASSAINLLQGPYAPQTSFTTDWRLWRVAAVLLAALVGLHAAGSAAELLSIRHAQRRVDAAVTQTFRQAMPGERNPIDARRRMEQRLESLGRGDSVGLLAALDALASAHASASDTVLRSLQYRDGTLELEISAPNPDAIDRLTQRLRAAGWQAQLTAGNAVGARYEGHVRIRAGV